MLVTRKRKLVHVVRQWFSSFKKDFGRLNTTLILTKNGIFFTTPLLLYSYSRLFKISLVLIVVAEVGSINHDDDGSENVEKSRKTIKNTALQMHHTYFFKKLNLPNATYFTRGNF